MGKLENLAYPLEYREDRWWQARQKTSSQRRLVTEQLISFALQSMPGSPTRRIPQRVIMEDRAVGVDLNKYRTQVDVKMLADLGVKVFDLRLFGPTQWVWNLWNPAQDVSFEPYLNQLIQIPGIYIGAYGVYNPWYDEEANYTSPEDPNVTDMKLYAKNYLQYLHYLVWDVEVSTCVKGANQNNGITSVNLVKGLGHTMIQTLKGFGSLKQPDGSYLPRIPEMYSANWYLRQYGEDMKVFLENNVKQDLSVLNWLPWMAWYLLQPTKSYSKPADYFAELPTPNGVQENSYLHDRSELIAPKWQVCSNLIGPWCKDGKGIDASLVGYGMGFKNWLYNHNIPAGGTTPPPPPPPPDDDWQKKIEERLGWVESRLDLAEEDIDKLIGHTHGGPVFEGGAA